MEYLFGKKLYDGKETEYVKVSDSNDFPELPNGRFVTYTYESDSITITHTFRVLWSYMKNTALDGKYQAWYYIDNHTKEVNNLKPLADTVTEHSARLDEQSDAIDEIIIQLLQ